MRTYVVVAEAYDKDGKKLNGNTHNIKATSASDAERMAASGQKFQVGTVKVETRIISTRD